MYNNVIYNLISGADIRVVNDADGEWKTSPRLLTGSNNWVRREHQNSGRVEQYTFRNTSPFANADEHDYLSPEVHLSMQALNQLRPYLPLHSQTLFSLPLFIPRMPY